MTDFDAQRVVTRRNYLRGIGAAAGTAALAGCSGGNGGNGGNGGDGGRTGTTTGSAGGGDPLKVAYMPIYPDMQHFVMAGEGYLDDLPVEVQADQFSDGPSIVQAYAKGTYDVALFGIVPAMIVVDKTGFAKVTAANIQNAMKVLANEEFATLWEDHGADAFAEFEDRNGRKFTFGTFPPGSVPDILLRYWLESELGLDPETAVDITPLAGAGPVRQALLADEIDGTSIMEPVPTIVQSRDAPYREIAWAGDFMPGQPAAVTMMHDDLRTERPDLARAYLEQHVRATGFIQEHPDQAAAHASDAIGRDVLPVDVAERAMASKASDFVSNPHQIADGTDIFADYAHRLGKTEQDLAVEDVFDYSLYDEVTG
ncbi:MAG: ABC transporter substrate-binding protein [Haloarculaceae archaeon]